MAAAPAVQVLEPYLRSLHSAVADLSRPLALERIAAVVCDAAMEALDVQALVIAVHDNGGSSVRGVHTAGLPDDVRERICARSTAAPELVGEIDGFLRSSVPGRPPSRCCRSPRACAISVCSFSAGTATGRSPPTTARSSTC